MQFGPIPNNLVQCVCVYIYIYIYGNVRLILRLPPERLTTSRFEPTSGTAGNITQFSKQNGAQTKLTSFFLISFGLRMMPKKQVWVCQVPIGALHSDSPASPVSPEASRDPLRLFSVVQKLHSQYTLGLHGEPGVSESPVSQEASKDPLELFSQYQKTVSVNTRAPR